MTREVGGGATPGHVWIDGEILPADGSHLSVFDRGFQLGDAVFETLRVRGGHPTELAEHVARLHRSAAGLDIALPDGLDGALSDGIAALLAADGLDGPSGDASVRVTVSREAPINSPISSCVKEKRKRVPCSVFWPLSLQSSNSRASFSGAVEDNATVRSCSQATLYCKLNSWVTV
jgi:hypothetical protein